MNGFVEGYWFHWLAGLGFRLLVEELLGTLAVPVEQTLTDLFDEFLEVSIVGVLITEHNEGIQESPEHEVNSEFLEPGKGFLFRIVRFKKLVRLVDTSHQTVVLVDVKRLEVVCHLVSKIGVRFFDHACFILCRQNGDLLLVLELYKQVVSLPGKGGLALVQLQVGQGFWRASSCTNHSCQHGVPSQQII